MTCERVADVIDAGPFVDHSREQLAAAHAHVRDCDRCATALERMETLTARLETMPSPGPSRDLTQNVMARILALDARVSHEASVQHRAARTETPRVTSWLPAAGAMAAVAATVIVTASVSTSTESLLPSVAGFRMGLFAMPGSRHELFTGVVSAALYAFGLFVSDRFTYRQSALPRRHEDTEGPTGSS